MMLMMCRLELLLYYKNLHHESEYQDCYGIFIKVQDLIDNFTESLPALVRRDERTTLEHLFLSSKIGRN